MNRKVFAVVAMVLCVVFVQAQKKQNISVLFVGNSPNVELNEAQQKNMAWTSSERYVEDVKTRMPAFVNYLNNYFAKVESVDINKYTPDMSANFDVTVFDEVPKPIKERVYERDPVTGQTLKYEPAEYLPADFNRSALFIGHTADRLGRPLGSKLDWYCLCLTKWAHSIKTEHPIFQGPFKVDITLKNRPTPSPVLKAWDGGDMPAEIPMWTVNTEDYTDDKGYRIGMVSRGWGFEDFPDAEVISSGQCDKQKTAVALGRHGNFFLWGFAGSPDYMTDEAKKVFANAIVYTHKNADKKIIAPKYNDRIATKVYLDELLHYTTKASHDSHVKVYEGFNAESQKAKEAALKKQAAGEELGEREKMILNFEPQPIVTREQYLEKNFYRLSWGKEVGLDTLAIRKYIIDNRSYFYSEPTGFYEIKVDEDIKSLSTANTDSKVLDAAISLLEKNENDAKAKRILWRYTIEDFSTAKEWRNWYEKYKDNMFFTEAGGFVWMINDADANPDVRPRDDIKEEAKADIILEEPTHAEPVSIGATFMASEDDGNKTVVIKTKIMGGYHIYAYVPAGEAYINTKFEVELPEGVEVVSDWKKSPPAPYPGKANLLIYNNESEFKQEIKVGSNVAKGTKIKCSIYYQCCDTKICFPPKKKVFELEL